MFCDYLIDVLLFYSLRYFLIPFLVIQKRWHYWILAIPVLSFITFLLFYFVNGTWALIVLNKTFAKPTLVLYLFSLYPLLIVSVFASLSFYIRWSKQKEIEAYKSETLRQQALVDPHILMNGLNSIYELSLVGDKHLPEKIMLMSENLRFALNYKTDSGLANLKDEIDHLHKYIEMRKFIGGYKYYVRLRSDIIIDANKIMLPPAIFTAFVDNMFKYGNLSDENHPGLITITCDKKLLELHVFNNKKLTLTPGTGFGIANTEFRLRDAFGKRYKLDMKETGNDFEINLTIKL